LSGRGVTAGAREDRGITSPPLSPRGSDLERPLGGTPAGQSAAGRPGFGFTVMRNLRATELRLREALNNRSTTPLVNSMQDANFLRRANRVNRMGLGGLFPLPGMKGSIKAILETYNDHGTPIPPYGDGMGLQESGYREIRKSGAAYQGESRPHDRELSAYVR
jgi:hypothetical protein